MKLVLLFVVFVAYANAWPWSSGPECTFTRADALECIRTYVDTNHDDVITLDELEAAKSKYMTTAQKAGAWVASWFSDAMKTETILRNCDYNHDGKFTPSDFEKATATCIPTQHGLCLLGEACERAKQMAQTSDA